MSARDFPIALTVGRVSAAEAQRLIDECTDVLRKDNDAAALKICAECGGRGLVFVSRYSTRTAWCSACNGDGRVRA